jgi:hypothetical protein
MGNPSRRRRLSLITDRQSLKEQAGQIQKVSAQLEANKPAPQVVDKSLKPRRPSLLTRIVTMESVWLCTRMKS